MKKFCYKVFFKKNHSHIYDNKSYRKATFVMIDLKKS